MLTGRNVTIAGDLTVNGTTTTVNSQTLAVVDPLIQLAKANTANSLDIGFYGDYNDGTGRFLGLFSDASDSNKFKLFKGTTVEPTTTVNIGGTGYVAADLVLAGLEASDNVSIIKSSAVNLRVSDGTQNVYVGSSGNTRFGQAAGASIIQSTGAAFGIGTQDGNNFFLGTNNTAVITMSTSSQTTFAGNIVVQGTGTSSFDGDVLVEDNLYLTDSATVRAKIQLNSSDRDNLDIKAVSLGSTMNFFTADTLALGLDASQNATFAGTVTATNLSGTSSGTNTGDQSLVGLLSKDKDDTTTGTITFGPNKTWGKFLTIGGDSNHSTDEIASIGTTDGNLHLDAATKHSTYLNYYDGQGGVAFGSGAGGVVAWMGADGDLWKGASDNSGSRYLHQGDITSTQISNWDTAYGYGNHASAGYLKRTKPEEPKLDSKIVGETIEVIITASGTSNIDQYLVFSSIVGSDYGLIAVLSPEDFKAEMTVVDSKFDKGGKIDYRVYAVKQGVYSSVSTTTQTFSVGTLEPTNVSVISLNTAHYIQWDAPSSKSRFVKNYEVYHHEHDTEGSLSRDSATKIYSGLNTSFMRKESNTKFHQFWVEIDEA